MEKLTETAKAEILEAKRFLLTQSKEFIINTWLLEFLERKRAVGFIKSKGLHTEYVSVKQSK